MSRHYLISAEVDMVKFVADLLLEHKPLSRSMCVFPGKRPGYFLHKHLADRLKTAYQPPRILGMDGFVQELAEELGLTGRTLDAIDCLALIYRLNDKSRVVGGNRPELTLDEFLVWGFKLFDDFEELCIEEVGPEALKTVETLVEDKLPSGIRQKLNALSGLYESFHQDLDKKGLITRALQYRRAADRVAEAKFEGLDRVYVCGLFSLTKAEKRIFRRLADDGRFQFVLQDGPGIDRIVDELGIKPERTGAKPEDPEIRFYKAMDGHAEIFKLNQVLQKEKGLGARDVIVLPRAEALFPLVQNALAGVKEYNISMGYPVYRTPLNTLVNCLARLREAKQADEYPVAEYMRFVLHPYVKNIYVDRSSAAGRIIFHAVEEEFMENQRRFLSLSGLEQDQKLLDGCVDRLRGLNEGNIDRSRVQEHLKRIHDVMVRPFENIKNIADAAQKIIEVISFVSKESPANRHPYTVSFIKAMIDGLHELQVSGLGPEKLSAADRYFRLIRNYIAEIEHPFPGTPVKGLQVLGFLETRNIKFDRVFLLDVNEGVLPSARKEDTTLPFAVRKALGLSTHEDQERKDRYYFDTLISGSRQADIFYVEGEDKEKSRFAERRIWELQKKSGKLEYPSDDIFFPVQFSQTDPRAVKKSPRLMAFVEREMTFSPSSLDGYLRCPLKYYYGDILGLKAKAGVAEDPDPMGVGSLVHKILMNFFLARVGEPLRIGKADYQDMEKAIDEGFREDYPDADRGSVYLIKSQARRQLKILLEFHDKRFNNIKILECENRKTASQPYRGRSTVSAELKIGDTKSVTVRGKIDRVDDRAGRIYIIDYKTGYWAVPNNDKFVLTNREDWSDTLVTVQLPAYIFLYSANNPKVKVQEMNAGLMLLGGKAIEEVMLFDDAMPQDRRVELYGNYLKAIVSLINEIRDPERDFLPCADSDTCDWCDFKTICGRQWVV